MADKLKIDKKELLESIQYAFSAKQGNVAGMFNDLKDFLKSASQDTNTELDEFAKSLSDNEDSLRDFYAKAVEDLRAGKDIVINNTTENKVSVDNTTEVKEDNQSERTFRDILEGQMEMNQDFLSSMLTSQNLDAEGLSSITSSISDRINKELTDILGIEGLDQQRADEIVADMMGDIVDNIDRYQDDMMDTTTAGISNLFEGFSNVYDMIGEKFSDFFGTPSGRTLYDMLNMITMGNLGILNSMWSSVGNFRDIIGEIYSGISKQVDKVFGEEKEALVDPVVDVTQGIGRAFVKFKSPEEEQLDIAEESKNILDDILKIQADTLDLEKQKDLRDQREPKEQTFIAFIKELLEKALFGIGFVIGGLVGAIAKPFQVLSNAVSAVSKMLFGIENVGARVIGVFSKIPIVGTAITKITDIFGDLMKWVRGISKSSKILGFLFRGLASGFRVLAWPINILLGVIDFFKGFFGSKEETFLGKLKDGLTEVLVGFFDLPLRVLGWVFDKVMGLFGVEMEGTGQKLVDWFRTAIDFIFNPIISVFNTMMENVKTLTSNIMSVIRGIFGMISNVIGFFWNILTGDFDAAIENISGIWENVKATWFGIMDTVFNLMLMPFRTIASWLGALWDQIKPTLEGTIFEPMIEFFETIGDFIGKLVDWVKKKVSSIPLVGRLIKDEEDAEVKKVSDTVKKVEKIENERVKIREQIAKLEAGEGWVLGSRDKKIQKLKDKEAELANEANELLRKDYDKPEKKKGFIGSAVSDTMGQFSYMSGIGKSETPEIPQFKQPEMPDISRFTGDTLAQFKHMSGKDDSVSPEGIQYQEHINTVPKSTIPEIVNNIEHSKQEAAKRQYDQFIKIEKSIEKMNKDANVKEERPIIVNTGDDDKRMFDPPEDIESMSILWLNKSWGLG